MMPEIGFIAADTSRTRAYLAALERHALLPSWTLLLDDSSPDMLPGQCPSPETERLQKSAQRPACWSETDFNPVEPLRPWLERLAMPYTVADSRDINSPEVIQLIADSAPSVLIYSGYGGVLLRHAALATGKRFLHVHGGYLPDFKGSTTNYYSLLAENSLGASSIFLTEAIDSGPILVRRRFPPPEDRARIDHLHDSAARAHVLVETLRSFQQHGEWRYDSSNDPGGRTYYIIHPVLKHIAILGDRAPG